MTEITREMLESSYEDATGLNARRGTRRIDNLEAWVKEHNIENFEIFDDTDKMRSDFYNGIRWYTGTRHGDTICLGYTSGRANWAYKNAIFAQSDEISTGE